MAANTPPPTHTYPAFTSQALGEGLFDQLMLTMKGHVHEEYAQQRITSADYARVFLGTMEAALSNTTQFLMAGLLLDLQKMKIEAEIRLIDLEGEKLRFEIDYMYPAQLIKLEQEGLLIAAQVRLAEANILKTRAEILKIEAEIALMVLQEALIAAQIDKIEAEISFINAKILTEMANTTTNFTPGSIVGRQTNLLRAQQLGFSGELHHKVAKLHADYQAVHESVNELATPKLPASADGSEATAIAIKIDS
jgi:hypothetical protein